MNQVSALPARHKIDVDTYYRMAEMGLLGREPRVELIDGDVIDMAPIGQLHAGTVDWLTEALVLACQGKAIVRVQNPVPLDRFNEPQPDVAVLKRRDDYYRTGDRGGPADVPLLIEVADSSMKFDRTVKRDVYARAGIAEYWIVDLKKRVLWAYRQPGQDGYAEPTQHRRGERLALALAPEISIELTQLFR